MTDPTLQSSAAPPGPGSETHGAPAHSVPGAPVPQQEAPGERRLAHPPSDRYRVVEPAAPTLDPGASATRGKIFGFMAADAGAVAITILGGVLALSGGLLVVAGVIGWAVTAALRIGAGPHVAPGLRLRLAVSLAIASVALGQLGLWVYALSEGGVLGPLDYLGQTFGVLVPLEFLAAVIVARVAAR